MDRDMIGRVLIIDAIATVLAIAVLLFAWFYLREQFVWGIILAMLLLASGCYLSVRQVVVGVVYMGKRPAGSGPVRSVRLLLKVINAVAAVTAFLIWAFAWFYMREQIMWAIIFTLFLLVPVECLNLLLLFYDYFSMREKRERRTSEQVTGRRG